MATAILPDAKKTASILGSTLRREVKVTVVKPVADKECVSVGHFADRDKKPIGICIADKALTIYAGAALSLVPADAARDAMKETQLDEVMRENFAEVLNVCSRIFEMSDAGRVMLTSTEFAPAAHSAATTAGLAKPAKRVDYEVEIQGYGKGRIGLALVPA